MNVEISNENNNKKFKITIDDDESKDEEDKSEMENKVLMFFDWGKNVPYLYDEENKAVKKVEGIKGFGDYCCEGSGKISNDTIVLVGAHAGQYGKKTSFDL